MKKLFLFLCCLLGIGLSAYAADEAYYTIKFVTGENSSTNFSTTTSVAEFVAEGGEYLSGVASGQRNSFPHTAEGIRVGSKTGAGNVTFNLSDAGKVKATRIIVNAKGNNQTSSHLTVNGLPVKTASATAGTAIANTDYKDYEFKFPAATEISQLVLTGYARIFITSITVYYETVPITPSVAKPTFTPASGTSFALGYDDCTVSLSSAEGNSISFKVEKDGSVVRADGDGNSYTFTEVGNYTITAYCYDDEMNTSENAVAKYTVTPKPAVAAVTFDPASGSKIRLGETVSITSATSAATLNFTLTTPAGETGNLTNQKNPLTFTPNAVGEYKFTNVVAKAENMDDSEPVEATFNVIYAEDAATPTFSPENGKSINLGETISISSTTEGAKISCVATSPSGKETLLLDKVSPLTFTPDEIGTWTFSEVYASAEGMNNSTYAAAYSVLVKDPNNLTAQVVMANQDWTTKYSNGIVVKWESEDKAYTFETSATVSVNATYPAYNAGDAGLRLYTTSNNVVTVNAPEGYKFVSATATSTAGLYYNDDKTVTASGTAKDLNGATSFTFSIETNKKAVKAFDFELAIDTSVEIPVPTFTPATGTVFTLPTDDATITINSAEGNTVSFKVEKDGNVVREDADGNTYTFTEVGNYTVTAYCYDIEMNTSANAVATYTVKKLDVPAAPAYSLGADRTSVTFTSEGADQITVVTYQIDGESTTEIIDAASTTVNCNSMAARFEVTGKNAAGETNKTEFNLINELNATTSVAAGDWTLVENIADLKEGAEYIILGHSQGIEKSGDPTQYTVAKGDYLLSKTFTSADKKFTTETVTLPDDRKTISQADAANAAIFTLKKGTDGFAIYATNMQTKSGAAIAPAYVSPKTNDTEANVILTAEPEYATVSACTDIAIANNRQKQEIVPLTGAAYINFSSTVGSFIYLRYNTQAKVFRCYDAETATMHNRPVYFYTRATEPAQAKANYTVTLLNNELAATEGVHHHSGELTGLNEGDEVTLKVVGFDGKEAILYNATENDLEQFNNASKAPAKADKEKEIMLPSQTYAMKLNGHSMVYNAKPFENVGKFEVEAEFTPFVGATVKTNEGVPTGIEDVEAGAEEGEVEYFNLQGVRVMNPTNGIYIRKYGSKVTKVCL